MSDTPNDHHRSEVEPLSAIGVHLGSYSLECKVAGELLDPRLEEHLSTCAQCAERLHRLVQHNQTFLEALPPAAFVDKLPSPPVAVAVPSRGRFRPLQKWWVPLGGFAMAAAMVFAIWPADPIQPTGDTLQSRGPLGVEILEVRDGALWPIAEAVVPPGTRVRVRVTPGQPGYVCVFHVLGDGRPDVISPEPATKVEEPWFVPGVFELTESGADAEVVVTAVLHQPTSCREQSNAAHAWLRQPSSLPSGWVSGSRTPLPRVGQ